MRSDIVQKLNALLQKGITSEAEVIYLAAQLRKLDEQKDDCERTKNSLCVWWNWALHSRLDKNTYVRSLLAELDQNIPNAMVRHLLTQEPYFDLLPALKTLDFQSFRSDLQREINLYGLNSSHICSPERWKDFITLYCNVIQDCELTAYSDNLTNIRKITLRKIAAQSSPSRSETIVWLLSLTSEETLTIAVN